jgi:hypothetical protein
MVGRTRHSNRLQVRQEVVVFIYPVRLRNIWVLQATSLLRHYHAADISPIKRSVSQDIVVDRFADGTFPHVYRLYGGRCMCRYSAHVVTRVTHGRILLGGRELRRLTSSTAESHG